MDIPKNRKFIAEDNQEDCLRALRTKIFLWGREKTLVTTFNPDTKRKKIHDLTRKLDRTRSALLEFRRKYNAKEPQWLDEATVRHRYSKLCEDLHISPKFYDLEFEGQKMRFRKNV